MHDGYAARANADPNRMAPVAADAPLETVRKLVLAVLQERGHLPETRP